MSTTFNHNSNNSSNNKNYATNEEDEEEDDTGQHDPSTQRPLRRGDLVRVSERGLQTSKRLKDRSGHLGRIAQCKTSLDTTTTATSTVTTTHTTTSTATTTYDVDWVLGGQSKNLLRHELLWTNEQQEGMTNAAFRAKRKPMDYMTETIQKDQIKQQQKLLGKKRKLAAVLPVKENDSPTPDECAKIPSSSSSLSMPLPPGTSKKKTVVVSATTTTQTGKRLKPQRASSPSQPQPQQQHRSVHGGVVVNNRGNTKKNGTTIASSKTTTTTTTITTTGKSQKSRSTTTKGNNAKKGGGGKLDAVKDAPSHNLNSSSNAPTATTVATEKPTASSSSSASASSIDLYERHRREFERMFLRLKSKIDIFHHFWKDNPNMKTWTVGNDNHDNVVVTVTPEVHNNVDNNNDTNDSSSRQDDSASPVLATDTTATTNNTANVDTTPPHVPPHQTLSQPTILNWETIQQYMDEGRYVLDRIRKDEMERRELFGDSYHDFHKWNENDPTTSHRVVNPKGVHWEVFRSDVFAMCDNVLELLKRQQANTAAAAANDDDDADDDNHIDDGQKGSVSYTVRKLKEAVHTAVDRTGRRHESEMKFADDRYKYIRAIESHHNTEPAMQSWRKVPYPERIYERLNSDVVCAGLSEVDEKIAAFELRTSLPNSFIGQSYRYDDTGQSEAWMKSVVDETGYKAASKKSKRRASNSSNANASNSNIGDDSQKTERERLAALALAADEGVTRAQVSATMQSLLIAVQDRVMTQRNVLKQPELRSANWFAHESMKTMGTDLNNNSKDLASFELLPEIIEQPVWGIDCYTRRNIMSCLGTEFDDKTSLLLIEKWLLPAINACPEDLGHMITNAARILEGQPLDEPKSINNEDADHTNNSIASSVSKSENVTKWSESLLGRALLHRIAVAGPLWLKAAANQLRCACDALGPDFFRVHPKGHGSVVLSASLKPNTLVTFYRGELYPSWRWGEKMDAIDITQSRKDLKPALPDFYNMALERPQNDPRGYGLLFVDASRKAGHGSSLSHSCAPTCEVRVAACDGELCLAMTTLRELEMGEELTFDYNAVTESLNEYRSAVCLCGYGKCRGSFLHFATADCYQQVLNRNSPIASRFANMIKGSMKQVMSPDDEQILRSHGFLTAAFGAISVNRRADTISGIGEGLVDSLDIVPVWLRTYVADALRYIEYERRALPIALICEHLLTASSNTDSTDELAEDLVEEPSKERKQTSSFFFFLRNQSDFLHELLKKEGFPENLKGLQFRHAMLKVASNFWSGLPDEKKKDWKEQARLDFDKRNKEGPSMHKKLSVDLLKKKSKEVSSEEKRKSTELKRDKSKPEIQDILNSSKISFQDADAEGVVAMEQRIQQLTQTLSRVGRVLDRHRESLFETTPQNTMDAEHMRKLVHAPVKVLSDAEVIEWIWKSKGGLVLSLCREVQSSRFVRPSLHQSIREILENNSFDDISNKRRQLKDGLLKLRAVIVKEVNEMGRELRQLRTERSTLQSVESGNPTKAVFSDNYSEENVPPDVDDVSVFGDIKKSTALPVIDVESNIPSVVAKLDKATYLSHPWLEFYGERFILQAAADVLLMYAYTTNFFVFEPYLPLESTPVEVYARELGNSVPRTAIDTCISCGPEATDISNNFESAGSSILPVVSTTADNGATLSSTDMRKDDSDLCAPDDIVAKVTIRYDGNYIASQLLQWYNAGIGQKAGLPDLLGCALLPDIVDCWHSDQVTMYRKTKGDGKTKYELKVRPRLVQWMQDPYERGNPWPAEIRTAFVNETLKESPVRFAAFGSPVIDFLVTGDESNIVDILYELDADDKIAAKKSSEGLLSSLDKGRPAQAVSTWVQCEDPNCMKWRKIPWYVDADLLPERFFCKDNMWNPEGNSCDALEDDWDKDDAMVGSDGKVEGSPVNKKKFEGSLPVDEESSFRIGTRFDVQRSDKSVFSIATVVKVDFSGSIKRIMFHYAKTSSDRDEWVEFGSSRIAPRYTKVPKKNSDSDANISPIKEANKTSQNRPLKKKRPKSADFNGARATSSSKELDVLSHRKKQKCTESGNARSLSPKVQLDPSEKESYVVGAQFDVFRVDKQRFFWATVLEVDCSGSTMKICFRFPKTKDSHQEWLDFGSPYICPFKSKVAVKTAEEPVSHVALDPLDEASFSVGAQFDVYRKEKKRHSRAVVCDLEYVDGRLVGIWFQYKDGVKELMEFRARTIFPFRSKLKKREARARKTADNSKTLGVVERNRDTRPDIDGESKPEMIQSFDERNRDVQLGKGGETNSETLTTSRPGKVNQCRDPTNIDSFIVGALFDVYSEDKQRYYWAVVEDVDFSEHVKRICFRFKKYDDNHVEWIDFGSPRICTYKTRVIEDDQTEQISAPNVGANDTTTKDFDSGIMMNTEIESTNAADVNDKQNSSNTMNPPPHNVTNINGNSNIGRSYDQYSIAVSSMSQATLPTHQLPDFITHSNVSPYTSDNDQILQQQHGLDDHNNQMHNQQKAEPSNSNAPTDALGLQPAPTSETPLSTIYGSGGSIPPDWSGLDMLAAVTFGAAATVGATATFGTGATSTATASVDPASSAFAVSMNNTSSSGHGQSLFGWEGAGNVFSNHDRSYDSGNYDEPTLQNQQRYMPMWPQQEQQQYQSLNQGQRWYPTFDNFRMSQQQAVPVFPTGVATNGYDRLNHSAVSQQPQLHQQQQQQQQQWLNTTLLDGNINGSNNNSK